MKTEAQTNPEFVHLCELIENIPVAMLTNTDSEGNLTSRPMSPMEMDRNGALWFFIDLRHAKLEHMGLANLSFVDAARATYVSMSGRGEIHMDRARIAQLWTPLVRPWFPDGVDSEHLALLKFVPDAGEFWDAPGSRMVRMFALAASVLAGKPINMGDHDTVPALSRRLLSNSAD